MFLVQARIKNKKIEFETENVLINKTTIFKTKSWCYEF